MALLSFRGESLVGKSAAVMSAWAYTGCSMALPFYCASITANDPSRHSPA